MRSLLVSQNGTFLADVPHASVGEMLKDPRNVVWMDVQGYEGHVLAGAPELIAAGVPVELEFWPYGLGRAGTQPEVFLDQLTEAFARFIDLRDPARAARPIAEAAALYDRYLGPEAATELMLLRR